LFRFDFFFIKKQGIGGFVIDKYFDPARTEVPISDKVHWWLGRTLLLAGIVNCLLGLDLYTDVEFDGYGDGFFYAILAWVGVVVVSFIALSFVMKPKVH
jgi:hypothetical protein